MKKLKIWFLVVVTMFVATGCFPGIGKAAEFERVEFDLSTPTNFSRQALDVMKNYQNWTLSSDVRLNVVKTAVGKIGIEGAPVYDFRSNMVHSSLGVYYEPFRNVQFHADHVNNFDPTHLSANSLKGSDVVGVRLILINR